jgi:predicted nuclease with TOPRIM domain
MENAVLNSIKEKVHMLMSSNSSLKEQNIQLETKVSELKNTLEQQKSEIENFNGKVKMLKMAKSLGGDSGKNTEMKLKINELVREIDKCISLLNK